MIFLVTFLNPVSFGSPKFNATSLNSSKNSKPANVEPSKPGVRVLVGESIERFDRQTEPFDSDQ